jgi:hypothetical protein
MEKWKGLQERRISVAAAAGAAGVGRETKCGMNII